MSAATLATLQTEALAFIEAADYASAIAKLEAILVVMATMPDAIKGVEQLRWAGREQVVETIRHLQRRANAATGIQTSKLQYKTVTDA